MSFREAIIFYKANLRFCCEMGIQMDFKLDFLGRPGVSKISYFRPIVDELSKIVTNGVQNGSKGAESLLKATPMAPGPFPSDRDPSCTPHRALAIPPWTSSPPTHAIGRGKTDPEGLLRTSAAALVGAKEELRIIMVEKGNPPSGFSLDFYPQGKLRAGDCWSS